MIDQLSNKKVAIAIVLFNSAAKLPDCLDSLNRQNFPPELLDLIIVDNNSSDHGGELVLRYFPGARIITNVENLGFAAANNQVWELAKQLGDDYLVLLNDDTIVDPDWLSNLIATAESDAEVAAVQAKLLLWPEKNLINSFGNALHFLGFGYCNDYKQPDKTGAAFAVPYPSGGAVAIKMSALEKSGLFDAKLFMYHEDVDLGWHLRLLGFKILFEPKSVVYHKYSFAKASYKYYYMERNRLLVVYKNYRLATLLLLAPIGLVMEVGIIFFATKNGWLKEKFSGYFWLLKNFDYLSSERKKVQAERLVSDRQILKLFTGVIEFEEIRSPLLAFVDPILNGYFWLVKKIIFW